MGPKFVVRCEGAVDGNPGVAVDELQLHPEWSVLVDLQPRIVWVMLRLIKALWRGSGLIMLC